MKETTRKAKGKSHVITIRVTKKDKKILSEKAESLGLSVSEYIRLSSLGKKHNVELIKLQAAVSVCYQDIETYLFEKYIEEEDEEYEERVKRLWKTLSL